ncbi:MAG: Por secretion system protein [Muribaculaceae bacterium]|nr:Por secretion system protein [Muribaculaceae bacterium]
MKQLIFPLISCMAMAPALRAQTYSHTVEAESLSRGVVAVPVAKGVLVSWRSLVKDDASMTFDVLRDGEKVNETPLTVTNFVVPGGSTESVYTVSCQVDGTEVDSQSVKPWDSTYLKVHLDRPEGGISPAGGAKEMREYTYTPDDVSVGDVDGDGEYELIVKWHPTNAADNSHTRYTGNTILDCYKMDGTKLWRIDLGINIRSGNHYTQFMVYDFDGDGKAELICKTAPGTIDGTGKNVIMGDDDPAADYRKSDGTVMSGPEYLTVFDGLTGAEINTIAYNPPRSIRKNDKSTTGWGDNYGNRSERYLACVAYLDGEHPSAVFCRGYYTASYLWAVDFDGKKLTERWFHKSETAGQGAYGEGAHSITVGDVDGDGKDEIVYGAASIDDDGTLLYRTGAGHGDALHLSQMLPGVEGLQVYMPHEEKSSAYKWDAELRDARTGEILYGVAQSGNDNGRGLAANIIGRTPGYEYWSSTHRAPQNQGEDAGTCSPSINFRVYWDGDLLDELLDGTSISKVNDTGSSVTTLKNLTATYKGAASCNSTKKTPNLQADIFGDWREEIILHDETTESDLIIFTTPYSSDYKLTCLMQDRQYREAVAWQNVAYNQPPHLSYCPEEKFNTAGVIVVTNGYSNQMVNVGEEIIPINFEVKRATGVETQGAPEWVNVAFDAASLTGTVTGIPDEEGEYAFSISTTGSADGNEGKIDVSIVARRSSEATLMAYYSFENVSETTPNAVYGEATAKNGAGEKVDGASGSALHLNGSNYYIQEAYDTLDFGYDSFTLSLWIRSTDNAAYIVHKGSIAANPANGDTGNWVGIEVKNNAFKFAIDDDKTKTGFDVANASDWLDGKWHQIVMVRNTDSHQLLAYLDGELKAEGTDATGAINCAKEALVIGNVNVNFDNGLKGDIDELRIYRGALSSAQIKEQYESVSGIYDIMSDADGETRLTVVNATTGMIVRTSAGNSLSTITDGLAPDIYILVKENGNESETYKFVIR